MKTVRILAICFAAFVAFVFFGLLYVGTQSPETSVYLGKQVPAKYVAEVRYLGLLNPGEEIRYFYSDGFLDIKNGLYFVTDERLVIYCQNWQDPKTIIPLDEIVAVEPIYDDSFLNDSYVTVQTRDGLEMSFPVSSEYGRDKKFVNHIVSRMSDGP